MTVVRRIEIQNFRGIEALHWCPSEGLNCLIGAGDSGKTTILDAIDWCLGARRNISVTDADFHMVDVSKPIVIRIVLGKLNDALKNVDIYGDFLRGYDAGSDTLEEEPATGLETALWLHMEVHEDLEPVWSLHSSRAATKGLERNLKWRDREMLAPLRLGTAGDSNLSWRRGSLLNRLSEETPDASSALSSAARDARNAFGTSAQAQMKEALDVVDLAAKDLGINLGRGATAMLDVHAASFGSGTVSLHSEIGIPSRNMGMGSKRLLLAGMQKHASARSPITLVDELELGLEPHRQIRFLMSLGSKDEVPTGQVFATSHSPTVLQELTHKQLWVVRPSQAGVATAVHAIPSETQGLLRSNPSAFLAKSIVICEGKTEVGFLRGLNRWRIAANFPSMEAMGVALLDADGGDPDRPFRHAQALIALGYRVSAFMDSDVPLNVNSINDLNSAGGRLFQWKYGFSIEDAIFDASPPEVVEKILHFALQENLRDTLVSKVHSASSGSMTFDSAMQSAEHKTLAHDQKMILAKAAGGKKGWFKNVAKMEGLIVTVIQPNVQSLAPDFQIALRSMWEWVDL